MIEKIFYSEDKFVEFDLPEGKSIGTFLSGGADSSVMTYILAYTIQKLGLDIKIYPITCENLARPYNLRFATDVIERIEKMTGFKFELHLCFTLPNFWREIKQDEKVQIQGKYTAAYMRQFDLEFIYNGLTANPPREDINDQKDENRQLCRDDLDWRKKNEEMAGLRVPFIHKDKKVIAALYDKFNLNESLLPHTRSCEAEHDETDFFFKDCFETRPKGEECWWCKERAYGFPHIYG